MSGGRRHTLSPSLFPFLAVLICTLGTLILLLALVAQNASDHAVAEAQTKAKPTSNMVISGPTTQRAGLPARVVDSMIEEEEFRVEKLVSFRKQQTADVEERRDKIAHVEAHMQKIREELERLSREVEQAMSSDQLVVDEQRFQSLRQELAEEAETLEKLKSESGSQQPRVVIVPHKGPNGTDRRPIYLECTANGLVVWPEQIRISIEELERSQVGANPVEAALRVVRNHAMQVYGDSTPPYPLLVVRPDGIETYGAARGAMKDYDDQFGYELVPASVQIAMPAADSNLKQNIQQAVTQSIKQQSQLAIVARRNNIRSSGRLPVLSAASLDRDGRSSGFRKVNRDDVRYGLAGGNSATTAARAYASQQNRAGMYGSGMSRSGTNGTGRNGTGYSAEISSNSGGINPAQEKEWADDMRAAAAELRGRSGNGFDGEGIDGVEGERGKTGLEELAANGESQGVGFEMPEGELSQMESGSSNPNDGPFAEPPSPNQGTGGNSNSNSGPNSESGSGSAKAMKDQTASTQQTGSGAAQMNGQQSRSQGSDSDTPPPPQSSYSQTPSDKLAKPGQKEWALPRSVAGMNGSAIVRTIRAKSYGDRFVLVGTTRGDATEVFGVFNNDPRRAILEMATAVRDRVDRWGVALPGGRWQPSLEVEVLPGGETRFIQLQNLMRDSGVDVIAKP